MRRILRILFIALSIAALTVCLAVITLWFWFRITGNRSHIGVQYVWLARDAPFTRYLSATSEPDRLVFVAGKIEVVEQIGYHRDDDETPLSNVEMNRSEYERISGWDTTGHSNADGIGMRIWNPNSWLGRHGFVWHQSTMSEMNHLVGIDVTTTYITLPHWAAMIPGILALGLFGARWMRGKSKANDGNRCSQCGYDLRATPDRCPECGTSTSAC